MEEIYNKFELEDLYIGMEIKPKTREKETQNDYPWLVLRYKDAINTVFTSFFETRC